MTDARTKAVDAMLELLPHREVVEAFWDEADKDGYKRGYLDHSIEFGGDPATPATPRRIVSMGNHCEDKTIMAMDDGTMWSLEYSVRWCKWEWHQLPSVPQPEDESP